MSKGLEMMMTTLIKSVGIDPMDIMQKFESAYKSLVATLNNFDQRLIALEKAQQEQIELLKNWQIKNEDNHE
jgi:hypothetical protein